jgi:hypothetical protein
MRRGAFGDGWWCGWGCGLRRRALLYGSLRLVEQRQRGMRGRAGGDGAAVRVRGARDVVLRIEGDGKLRNAAGGGERHAVAGQQRKAGFENGVEVGRLRAEGDGPLVAHQERSGVADAGEQELVLPDYAGCDGDVQRCASGRADRLEGGDCALQRHAQGNLRVAASF